MLYILFSIFRQIKLKMKRFDFCYYKLVVIIVTPMFIITCSNYCKLFWWYCYADWYKRYIICLISFFSFFELFPAFFCANDIGSLANSLFRAKILNFFLLNGANGTRYNFSSSSFSGVSHLVLLHQNNFKIHNHQEINH